MQIKLMRLPDADEAVALPSYETGQAAGADVRANFPNRDLQRLAPGERALIPLGFAMEIPPGYEVQMRPRSGLALKQGVALVNSPGTIDADYRGPVGVIVINLGTEVVEISHGDRIAQMVAAPVIQAEFQETKALGETERGTGGFGSTGMR